MAEFTIQKELDDTRTAEVSKRIETAVPGSKAIYDKTKKILSVVSPADLTEDQKKAVTDIVKTAAIEEFVLTVPESLLVSLQKFDKFLDQKNIKTIAGQLLQKDLGVKVAIKALLPIKIPAGILVKSVKDPKENKITVIISRRSRKDGTETILGHEEVPDLKWEDLETLAKDYGLENFGVEINTVRIKSPGEFEPTSWDTVTIFEEID